MPWCSICCTYILHKNILLLNFFAFVQAVMLLTYILHLLAMAVQVGRHTSS